MRQERHKENGLETTMTVILSLWWVGATFSALATAGVKISRSSNKQSMQTVEYLSIIQ